MRRKKLVTLIGSICLILVLAAMPFMGACAPEEVTPTPPEEEKPAPAPEKSVLRISYPFGAPAGINPFMAIEEGDFIHLFLMYEPLLILRYDGPTIPWLAKSWEYKEEEKTWIFYLDERAHWSDGQPLTAEDVKFSMDTCFEHDFDMVNELKPFVESVQVVDEHTVAFNLKEPYAFFLSDLTELLVAPKHIWSKVDIEKSLNEHPVVSGPFLCKEYKRRAYLHLVKNEDYWRGPAHIDEVMMINYTDESAEVTALEQGDVDIAPELTGRYTFIPILQKAPDVKLRIAPKPDVTYVSFNNRIYPLNLKKVREAMNLVVDRKPIIEIVLRGYADPGLMGMVPPLFSEADTSLTWRGADMTEEERVNQANAILDELGFERGKDGIRITDKGERMEFGLCTFTWPAYVRIAEMIKEDLKLIGIETNVRTGDISTILVGLVYSGERPLEWDMFLHGSTVETLAYFPNDWAPAGPSTWKNANAFGWENEEIQSLLRGIQREPDEAKRTKMYGEVQKLFAEQVVSIVLAHKKSVSGYRTDKFTGWNLTYYYTIHGYHPLCGLVNILSLRPK